MSCELEDGIVLDGVSCQKGVPIICSLSFINVKRRESN